MIRSSGEFAERPIEFTLSDTSAEETMLFHDGLGECRVGTADHGL